MAENWDILEKELGVLGFKLIRNGVEFESEEGQKRYTFRKARNMVLSEIAENKKLLNDLWNETIGLLDERGGTHSAIDTLAERVFISAVRDLMKFLDMFDDPKLKTPKTYVQQALDSDILSFASETIDNVPKHRMAIEWTYRVVRRLMYLCKLLTAAEKGKFKVNSSKVKTARGIQGPWAHLDLPLKERLWEWGEEDENFRERGRDIRHQRRYRKGHENYNNDGRVGEGHYWREIKNEPFSFYDSKYESPYPSRATLRWN